MSYDPNQPNQGQPGQGYPQYPQQGPATPNPYGQPNEPYPPQGQPEPYPPPAGPYSPQPGYGQPGGPYPGMPESQGQGYPPPPPGGAYGSPYGTYAQPAPAAPQAPGLRGLFQRWQAVLTQPNVPMFNAQHQGANWSDIWLALLILGAFNAVSRAIQALENPRFTYTGPDNLPVVINQNPIGNGIGGFIGAFVGFFIASGILFVCAKIFGGQGSWLTHSWLLSLFSVPLSIIVAIAGIIPIVNGLVGIAAFIFSIFLAIQAIASAHRLTTGRAAAAVFLPLVVAALLACVLAIAAAAFFLALFKSIGGP